MRQSVSRFLTYCALALASCLGISSLALASDQVAHIVLKTRLMVADVGSYGAESAKLKAELASMVGFGNSRTSISANLIAESNGFRIADLMQSGVASGKTGVVAGAPTVA